ncbi:MAG: response regulator [Opitutales bacterium]|nr:response regulator [Opitutales bacterium]
MVDDDTSQSLLLKGCLKGLDTEIVSFSSAVQAAAYLGGNQVDYIFCDVMMPEMDGWELHSAVRLAGANRDTPFVFTTCLISQQQERGMADAESRCLTLAKPLRRKSILDAAARLEEASAAGAQN